MIPRSDRTPLAEAPKRRHAFAGFIAAVARRWDRLFPCPPEIREQVQSRQVAVLIRQSGPMAIIGLLCALSLLASLRGHVNTTALLAWTALAATTSVLRGMRALRTARADPERRRRSAAAVLRRAEVNSILLALMWAMVPLFFFVPKTVEAQVVVAVVIGSIAAGLVALTAAVPIVAAAFAVLAIPPLLVQFGFEGGRGAIVIAVTGLVYVFGLFVGLRAGYGMFVAGVSAECRAESAERRLRESIAALGDGYVLYGPDRRVVLYNAKFTEMFGYGPDIGDITGRHAGDLMRLAVRRGVYDEDPNVMRDSEAFIDSRLSHMETPPNETAERRLSGGRTVLAQSHVLPDGSTVGLFTDITRQKRAEQGLIDAIESLDDAFVLFGPDERVVVHNRRYAEFYDFMKSLPSVVGMSYEELNRLAVAHRFPAYPEVYADTEKWLAARLEQFRQTAGDPIERVLPNGRCLYLRQYRLADGSTVGIHTDVTALKRAEQRLADAMESLPDACILWDADDRLALHNRAHAEMFAGHPMATARGERFADILAAGVAAGAFPQAQGREEEFIRERVREHRAAGGTSLQRLSGDRWVRLSERRTSDGGIVGLRTDVTEAVEREAALRRSREELSAWVEELERAKFKLQEQSVEMRLLFRQFGAARDAALEANRAKSLFLANMSHELHTPLNAIIGFSEVMQAELFGPLGDRRYKGYAGDVLGAARHLLKLINDILDISKIEAGKWELRDETVRIDAVFAEALRLFKGRDELAALAITADTMPGLPDLIADERALKQIVINALSNAVKFTPAGGRIRLRARVDAAQRMHIAIADTGIGMRRQDLPRAFAPFEQIENRLSRKYEGTGLGLSIAKALAEQHGGRLRVRSEPGRGTVVVVTLPSDRVMGAGAAPPRMAVRRAA